MRKIFFLMVFLSAGAFAKDAERAPASDPVRVQSGNVFCSRTEPFRRQDTQDAQLTRAIVSYCDMSKFISHSHVTLGGEHFHYCCVKR